MVDTVKNYGVSTNLSSEIRHPSKKSQSNNLVYVAAVGTVSRAPWGSRFKVSKTLVVPL